MGSNPPPPLDLGRTALVVAHPGHELTIYHWVERYRPLYLCLTDGSGGSGSSRLGSTARLLAAVGASPGPLWGRYPDREVYRILLGGRLEELVRWAEELADVLVDAGVDCVAGDAVEGFNPSHDVCRFLIDAAVARARERTGREIHNYDFVLDGHPSTCPAALRGEALWLRLDASAVERKIRAALEYEELREEVQAALGRFGNDAFAVECLRPATTESMIERFEVELPEYERSGQTRVAQGVYRDVIRYRQHVLPLLGALEGSRRR
jgi:hypothetical protein